MKVIYPFNNVLRPCTHNSTLCWNAFSRDMSLSTESSLPNKLYMGLKPGHIDVTVHFQALNLRVIPFLLLLLPPSATSISFQRTRFDPGDPSIIYEGGASAYVGRIEFNCDSYMCQVGRATYATKVPLWDSSTARLTDFSTHFSFYIDIEGRTSYAAGFAFFIAPVEFHIPPNSAGGFLGLYNMTTSDSHQNHIVHIEFDSFANPEWDPRIQHVGVNNNSVSSATYT